MSATPREAMEAAAHASFSVPMFDDQPRDVLVGVSVRGGAPGPRPYGRRTLPASSLCIRRRSVVRGCGLVTAALLSGDIGLDDAISLQHMQQRHRERRGRCSAWYADCGLTGGCQALVVGR